VLETLRRFARQRENSATPSNATVSTSSCDETMRLSPISAHVTRPVRPSPPIVAANNSGFDCGEHSMRVPSERASSKRRTWQPKEPAT
jgi:hypothetical protein